MGVILTLRSKSTYSSCLKGVVMGFSPGSSSILVFEILGEGMQGDGQPACWDRGWLQGRTRGLLLKLGPPMIGKTPHMKKIQVSRKKENHSPDESEETLQLLQTSRQRLTKAAEIIAFPTSPVALLPAICQDLQINYLTLPSALWSFHPFPFSWRRIMKIPC